MQVVALAKNPEEAPALEGEVQSPDSLLPCFGFRADQMGADENIVAWREALATLFEVSEPALGEAEPFRADLVSYAMGSVLLGLSRASGQRFRRSSETIARSGVDHLIVQFYVRGGCDGVAGEHPVSVRAGDICVFDLAQTLETRATAFENFTLVVPRPMFDAHLIQVEDVHGLVLQGDGVLARLLARHLAALFEHAPRMTSAECRSVIEGTVSLIVACLKGELERRDAVRSVSVGTSLLRIRQHIETQLANADLTADSVARHFGLSRASLYRLFAPVGGIAEYIRSRRLHRAFFELAAPASRATRISEVARRWHLGSDAHFTRSFKAAYGITPSAAREAGLPGTRPLSGADGADARTSAITLWMRDIAPPRATD